MQLKLLQMVKLVWELIEAFACDPPGRDVTSLMALAAPTACQGYQMPILF